MVRIHPLSLRDGLDPSGFEVDMKTLITFQRYDKNLKFYKGICSANYNNFDSKYTNIASLQAGSYGVFPKSTKETPKICLVYRRKAGLMPPVAMHFAVFSCQITS